MKKHLILSALLMEFPASMPAKNQPPRLQKMGDYTRLMDNSKPILIWGGELGNSSISSETDMLTDFKTVHKMNLNTVLIPAYWDIIEPQEDDFNFILIDKAIDEAQKNNLKIVFFGFGDRKNSMSCSADLWFKKDVQKYPKNQTKSGKSLEIASAFSNNVLKADNRAFSKQIKHISAKDPTWQTVVLIQIKNKVGMLEDAGDYSLKASAAFQSQVPEKTIQYLTENRSNLHTWLLQKWKNNNSKTKGTWEELFGYALGSNLLFIPEIRMTANNGVQTFYVSGKYSTIGFSPIPPENNPEQGSIRRPEVYEKLKPLQSVLTRYQNPDNTHGLLLDQQNKLHILRSDDLWITPRHFFKIQWDPRASAGSEWPEGGGILIRLAKDDYLIAGSGIVVSFEKLTEMTDKKDLGEDGFATIGKKKQTSDWGGEKRAEIGKVEEISINGEGEFSTIRRLNGDQTHQGRHVRIDADYFQILHIKLYEY